MRTECQTWSPCVTNGASLSTAHLQRLLLTRHRLSYIPRFSTRANSPISLAEPLREAAATKEGITETRDLLGVWVGVDGRLLLRDS